jgi:hypothetical protein
MRRHSGKNKRGGLSYLEVPSQVGENPRTCQDWRTVDCPEEIELLLQERNRAHFGQSKDCNLTSEPFDFTMLFTGACHRAEAILNGTFTTDETLFPQEATTGHIQLRELTKIFLEACAYVNNEVPDKIKHELTLEEYKKARSKFGTSEHPPHPDPTCTWDTSKHTGHFICWKKAVNKQKLWNRKGGDTWRTPHSLELCTAIWTFLR